MGWPFDVLSVSSGFDLVGAEDSLRPLIYYAEHLLRFRQRQKEEGVDIPFIFHAGETLGDGTEADLNLYDAILLGTKRIGHGLVTFSNIILLIIYEHYIYIDFHLLNIPNLSRRVGRRALPWKYAQFRMSCVVYLLLFLSVKSRNEILVCVFQFANRRPV